MGATIRRFEAPQPSRLRIAAIRKLHGLSAVELAGNRVINHSGAKSRRFPVGDGRQRKIDLSTLTRPIFDAEPAFLW
jgi:hypothetical protein